MKIKSILAVIMSVMILFCVPSFSTLTASAVMEGYFTYTVSEDGEVTITGCDSSISGDVIIPSTIGDYPVINIGDHAFSNCNRITSVTIPNSVISIGENAFYFCTSIISITIPDNVTYLGRGAFGYCESLISVILGKGILSIGSSSFSNCDKLSVYCNLGDVSDILSSTNYIYKCFGDFDNDKKLSGSDTVAMRKSLLGEFDENYDEKVANINRDDTFDIRDLVHLKKKLVDIV